MGDHDARLDAVVLAGGRGRRLGGADKAGVEVGGRSLLARALDTVAAARAVVVVGPAAPTARDVRFVVEDPPWGGPVAGLLAGRDALADEPGGPAPLLAVVAVDMPLLTARTLARLADAAAGRSGDGPVDGAVLVDPDGRRQLALVLQRDVLDVVAPPAAERHGYPVHRLLAGLDLAAVGPRGREHRDVDTWDDVADLTEG